MSKAKGDRLILGNSMQSLSTLCGSEKVVRGEIDKVTPIFTQQQIAKRVDREQLSILDEAIAIVRAMTPEQLTTAFNATVEVAKELADEYLNEPDHHGDTTHGLNIEWINWYCKVHSCRVWKALQEGKKRLRAEKGRPKRKKNNPQ